MTQKKLADAQGKSPEIRAPFDGFVTKVNVAGGDEVLNEFIENVNKKNKNQNGKATQFAFVNKKRKHHRR